MKTEEAGKLIFVENGIPMVRNFTEVVLHFANGLRVRLKVAWVELVTGTGEDRPLHLLLSPTETERLVRECSKKGQGRNQKAKLMLIGLALGWLLRSIVLAL